MRSFKYASHVLVGLAAFSLQASYIVGPRPSNFPSNAIPASGSSTPPATGSSATGTTTVSVNLTPPPTVGNIVVVAFVEITNSTVQTQSMADNQNGAYPRLLIFPNSAATQVVHLTLWCSVIKASSGTFTITGSSTATSAKWISAKEYKNTTCNQDVTGVGATGNTHPYSCGSLSTVNAKDIVIALIGYSFGAGGTNTFTAPTGFTLVSSQTDGNQIAAGSFAENITSAAGTFSGTYDATNILAPSVNGTSCAQVAILSQ